MVLCGELFVNYSKPFSKNFEVLTQYGDVINPKLAQKRDQTLVLGTNGDRNFKIQSKRNFEVRYSFMKTFSRNLEIHKCICICRVFP